MKKFVFISASITFYLLPLQLSAQDSYPVNKGSLILGGSAGFFSQGGDLAGDPRFTLITINPQVLFFLFPNIAIGGGFTFVSAEQGDFLDQTTFGVGPTLAYYYGNRDSRAYPFVSISYLHENQKDSFTTNDLKFSGGAVFMVARNVGITSELSYKIQSFKLDGASDSTKGNTVGLEIGIAAFVF